MKKALLIYAVAATAVAIAALRGRARLHDENRRLGANIETLTDDVDLYRTKSGESAAEITSLRLRCSELERLTALLQKSSDLLTRQVGGAALAADERISAGREKLEGRTGAVRAELEMRRDLLRAEILDRQLGAQRLLRAFPTLKSTRYEAALRMLRQELGERLRRR